MSFGKRLVRLESRLAQLEREVAERDVRIAELEAENARLRGETEKSSRNSSKPPSSDSPQQRAARAKKPGSGRKPGGQPGHEGHQRALVPPEVDHGEMGGAFDNAWNYQGLVAVLSGLPISERIERDIEGNDSD